jgi:hypothetical protein
MAKQTSTVQTSSVNGNKPVHTVRHRNIKATIWRNTSEQGGAFFNVTITRSYKNGDEWHDINSFGYDDLMNVAKLMYDAHSFITELRAKESAQSRPAARH